MTKNLKPRQYLESEVDQLLDNYFQIIDIEFINTGHLITSDGDYEGANCNRFTLEELIVDYAKKYRDRPDWKILKGNLISILTDCVKILNTV